MLNTADLVHAVEGADIVMHLVSTTLPKGSNDDPVYDVQSNLVGTLQLLNVMVAKGVSRMIFISSGGTIYGNPRYLPVNEDHPTEPRVSYGITKLAIEKYLLMYQQLHGIRATILRVANPYGERQRIETAQGAVGVFLSRALRGEPLEIWGDGSVTRDYVYVGDVAEAFAKAVQYQGRLSVFNISAGLGTTLLELIKILENVLGREIACRFHPARAIDVPVNILDNTLAGGELGWHPNVRLPEGIAKTAHWMKLNQKK
jgi:UDP-glucose 4-epimerase